MLRILGLIVASGLLLYLFTWPVAIDPVAWQPDPAPEPGEGFISVQLMNELNYVAFAGSQGPEDLAINSKGDVFTGTHDGWVHRLQKDSQGVWRAEQWLNTGGRPLGLEFDADDNLLIADAISGLLKVSQDKKQQVLLTEIYGKPIGFLDDLDVLSDGRIIFSDASAKFPARDFGGTVEASRFDINEHGLNGSVYLFSPTTGELRMLSDQLSFANGIAVSTDERWVLINETGNYRILKVGIAEDNFAEQKVLVKNLAGFPDNIARASDGHFWVGLVSPRNTMLDFSAPHPWLRKIAQRLPHFLQPQPERFGHVIKIDLEGNLILSLQEPNKEYGFITGAVDINGELILSSLLENQLATLSLQ